MTTIINTPGQSDSDSSGLTMIIGMLIVVALAIAFFVYALPTLQTNKESVTDTTTEIKVNVPAPVVPITPDPATTE